MTDKVLMKGNEAIAEAAIIAGCHHFFGYPITPQTEISAYMAKKLPKMGGTFLQAESEIAAVNMVLGASAAGKRSMTTSSSPGIALKSEGLSYMAGCDLPAVIANVQRGGPGLGTIQPSQGDYFQATKGGAHGDFHMIVLAPASVQEMYDHVFDGFDLAFRYRIPVMMLSDGIIGQMMEKVVMSRQRPRWTAEEVKAMSDGWATLGKHAGRKQNVITSLELDPQIMEGRNEHLQAKYREIERTEVRFEESGVEDAEYVIVAFGSSARIASEAVEMARKDGVKVGLLRPITLWPFPTERIEELAGKVKGFLVPELNAGQMIEDVRLAVNGRVPVSHVGRMGGMIYSPEEIYDALKKIML